MSKGAYDNAANESGGQSQPWYSTPPGTFGQPGAVAPVAQQPGGMSGQAYASPTVVVQQPGGFGQPQLMSMPLQVPVGCPPGLEYLTQIDQLLIKQQVEAFEVITGFEMCNRYLLTNSLSQQVYFAAEDTDCLTRTCCGPGRPFEMKILDNAQREVIHLSRPLNCCCCCFPCCLQEIEICSPPGNVLGYAIQKYELLDADKNPQLSIQGPICPVSCGSDVHFPVYSLDGQTEVGMIYKQWTGCFQECITKADNFGVTFPMDLDVKTKAVMLGACFLIDFMFFENK